MYKTTNLANEKFYIGIHSTYNLEDGYLGSGKRLKRAVEKYGTENFKCEILEFFESRDEVLKREEEVVNEQLINDPFCMNLQTGGGGGFTKEICSLGGKAGNKKIKWLFENDEEWTRQTKINRTLSHKKSYQNGRKTNFPNWTGRKHSDETILKMKKSKNVGENNSQYGTCWIFKNKENKKIKKQELKTYLKNGWVKGRI